MLGTFSRLNTVLAAASETAVASDEPGVLVVVVTGISLVFGILVLLWLLLLLEGKLFSSLDERKKEKAELAAAKKTEPAKVAPPPVATSAPVVEAGIPPEVVAAISAAVASIEGGKYTLRSVSTAQQGRGQWGLAGVVSYTEPF